MDGCRIKLVPREKFYRLRQKHHLHHLIDNSIYPWKAKNILRLREKAYTDNTMNCNAGGVYNGKRVTLFHLDPDETRTSTEQVTIRDTLTQDVLELQKEAPVRGLITGGRAYSIQDDEDSDNEGAGANSQRLNRSLGKIMHQSGVSDISRIWGRREKDVDGFTNILYNPDKNTWYLNAQIDADDEMGTDILTLEGLRSAFRTVHLAKGDILQTPEGTFTHREVNHPSLHKLGNVFKNALSKNEKT